MTITIIIVAVLVVILVIWQTIQLQAIRKRVDAVPSDGNTIQMLQTLGASSSANQKSIDQLTTRLNDVEAALPHALSRMGVVAYDAFGNITGNQSRSIALLSEAGDGLVITLLASREETVFFVKEVRGRKGVEGLAPEEQEAVDRAFGR
ncbi:MAG: DUF4446 family protein [Acidimicrobiia bacterium]